MCACVFLSALCGMCVHVCRSICLVCACASVGLPCVCMCVGRSALCVHVRRSVCLVCACASVGLPCVCMCVGRSALCVHVRRSVCLVCIYFGFEELQRNWWASSQILIFCKLCKQVYIKMLPKATSWNIHSKFCLCINFIKLNRPNVHFTCASKLFQIPLSVCVNSLRVLSSRSAWKSDDWKCFSRSTDFSVGVQFCRGILLIHREKY